MKESLTFIHKNDFFSINSFQLRMNFVYEHTNDLHIVHLEVDGKECGKCSVRGNLEKTCSVSIHIDEKYQGLGYSKLMWKKMFENMKDIPELFFIDADASCGYWDHIGFVKNRYGYDYKGRRELIGRGYEKVISFRNFY